jgi:hypothetical protein
MVGSGSAANHSEISPQVIFPQHYGLKTDEIRYIFSNALFHTFPAYGTFDKAVLVL